MTLCFFQLVLFYTYLKISLCFYPVSPLRIQERNYKPNKLVKILQNLLYIQSPIHSELFICFMIRLLWFAIHYVSVSFLSYSKPSKNPVA